MLQLGVAYLWGRLATRGDLPPFHGASSGRQNVSEGTETSRTYTVIWKYSVVNPLPWVKSFLLPLTNASSPPGKMSALVTENKSRRSPKLLSPSISFYRTVCQKSFSHHFTPRHGCWLRLQPLSQVGSCRHLCHPPLHSQG